MPFPNDLGEYLTRVDVAYDQALNALVGTVPEADHEDLMRAMDLLRAILYRNTGDQTWAPLPSSLNGKDPS
jgi:hypothetical protein